MFDLNCIIFKDTKTLKEELTNILSEKKFIYKMLKNKKIYCVKKGLKFEIDFYQRQSEGCTILLPKRIEGKNEAFCSIIHSLINKLS